ncbi:MAG: hypothetical protein IJB74_05750 [Clostridia bacterium]|nr:hypothetical protein [Clostridia bacterium]
MLVTKREVKQTSKKLLSVLLAVIMIMTSMSVCFGTVSFAAGKDVDVTALADALKYDSIKNASFSGSANNYTVSDPDGKVLAAVDAYFAVVDAMANKTPTNQNPSTGTSSTNQTGESSDKTYRTINHLNARVKTLLSNKMGGDYTTYNVDAFITGLLAGSTVSEGTSKKTVGPATSNNTAKPATPLAAAPDVKLTVMMESAVTGYTLDTLPDSVVTSKTYTVKHANTNYDYKFTYTAATKDSCGNSNNDQKYQHDYWFYYNYSSYSAEDGASKSTQTIKNTQSTLETYADYFSMGMDALYAVPASTLDTVSTAVKNAKANVVSGFGAGVYSHFFSSYNVEKLTGDIIIAKEIQVLAPKLLKAYEEMEKGYDDIINDKDALNTLAQTVKTAMDAYDAASADAKTYVTEAGFIRTEAATFYSKVLREIELIELRELVEEITEGIKPYAFYTEDGIDEGTVTSKMIGDALTAVSGYQTRLAKYNTADVDDINPGIRGGLFDLKNVLNTLSVAAGYNDQFSAQYAKFASEIFSVTDANGDIGTLLSALQSYDGWYTGLKSLIAEMKSVLGEELADKLFDDLNDVMTERMDDAYVALNALLEAQIDYAYDLFKAYTSAYGEKVSMATVSEYRAMQASIGLINADAYSLLNGTANFEISDEAVAKYEEMQKDFPEYEEFLDSHGFSTYQQTFMPDLERPDTEKDIARENEDGVYKTSDAEIEKIINLLDNLLQNDAVKELLGSLINKDEETGEPTGEPFDIADLISGLLEDVVYTDSLINTIVQYVYPLVCKEFAKVWAGLPSTFTALGVETGVSLAPTADVKDCPLYLDDVEKAIGSVGVYLSPVKLAENLKKNNDYKGYTQVIAKLESATTKAVYNLNGEGDADDTFQNPWEDANLFTNVYDEVTGEQVFNDDGTPKQVYDLNWGVDEATDKKAAFINAACAALSGLEPLLMAIIADTTYVNPNTTGTDARGSKIGTGKGTAQVKGLGFIPITLTLNIDPITLVLNFQGNDGWDNALAPIFEALGLTNIPHSHELNTTRKLLEKGLFAMIDQLISKVAEAPVTFILEALPNLAYALEGGLVEPLLSMLKTEISYYADAAYTGTLGDNQLAASVLKEAMKSEEPIKINIGEMINLEDMGLDISSFQAIWDMIAGGVELLAGMEAPDAGKIATMGKLVERNTNRSAKTYNHGSADKAYHIEANKADVLVYLLKYVLGSGLIDGLVENPEGIIADLLTNLNENPDVILAAVVELFNQKEYDTLRNFEWFEGYINGESVIGNSANAIYLNPENDWTEEKAQYLYENLDSIVSAVLTMAKLDLDKETEELETLGDFIGGAIGGLLSDKTLTALAKLLGSLADINSLIAGEDAAEPLPVDVAALLTEFLGIDLSVYADYADIAEDEIVDFGVDAGTVTFAEALADMLAPLSPVLDFILAGENLVITVEDETVELVGYDGYNNAIIPILEALGCDVAVNPENALEAVITALMGKIEAITKSETLIKDIIDLLPGVFYFIASKGLSVSVRNLLQPVYVILDTVRPVFDLDLNATINDLLPEDFGIMLNIDDIGLDLVFDLLKKFVPELDLSGLKDVIYDICYNVGTEYESVSTLQDNWKKGAFGDNFSAADLLTVVLSFVLEWATVEENGEKLDEMLGTEDLIANIGKVFEDVEIAYGTPNWMYWFATEEEFNSYVEGNTELPNTLLSLTYPNDWSEEAAAYIADNLASLVDMVISLIEIDGTKYASVAELIDAKLDVFNAETINSIIGLIADLLKDVDDNLLSVGYLLDVDVVGLKNYTCTAEITDVKSFTQELANILTKYAHGLVNWLFFGDDFRFAKKSDKTDTIVINGGEGYEKGLALVLEALGCDLPEKATTETVLLALAARVEEILASPVNEVIDLLPNLVYFLNADGASVAVNNLLAPVYALLDKLAVLGVELDLATLLGFDLKYLSLADILALVKDKTGLDISAAEEILVNLCFGKIEQAEYTYKMVAERKDVVTVVLTTALLLVKDEDFAAKLEEMMGTELISAIVEVFESAPVTYKTPDWYALDESDIDYDNETVGVIKYAITYPNNWTEESAKYLADNLVSVGDMVAGIIDSNYDSLGALLADKVNIYTADTLKAIQNLLGDLIGGLDENLKELVNVGLGAADALLGADVQGLLDYDVSSVNDKASFIAALTGMLMEVEGLVDWLLLGQSYELFVDDVNANGVYDEGEAIITLNGGHGYAEGLALVLEALGVENLPDVYAMEEIDTEAVVGDVLNAVFDRVDAVFNNPVEEVFEILPNVLYFINANGLTVAIENLIGAVNALLIKLEGLGVELDIASLVNFSEILGVETELALDNITIEAVIDLVAELTGLNLDAVADVLVGFALGRVAAYDSVSSADITAKMYYHDDFAKYDMITVLATVAIIILTDEANAEKVKDMLGEDIYQVVLNLVNMGEVEIQEFNWMFTSEETGGNRVGETFSALESSEVFAGHSYGPTFTEEMAQYIADNFGKFVDNVIYLLGIDINSDGKAETNLTETINSLLNGSLYNSENVIAVRDALAGVLANLTELQVNGKVVGGLIADVLKTTGIADIAAVAEVEIPEFKEDRAQFVAFLCDVLEPLYGILRYVLADEDFTFFVNAEKSDAITLKGAEGYAYGILPLLETLECEGILAPADYYAAVEADGDVLLTSILNPLLDRVDVILEAPADEILAMLPNLIYFINSNGVDTVVKNTLNAVYALLAAIEPIAKIDLYELIGVDLAVIDFEWLLDKLLEVIKDATGYEFTVEDIDYILELTVGKLEAYDSLNGKTAYKMVYSEGEIGDSKELVVVVLRLIVTFIANENNAELLVGLLRDNLGMSAEVEEFVRGLLTVLVECISGTKLGVDVALSTLYYVFFGIDKGVGEAVGGTKTLDQLWRDALSDLRRENEGVADMIEDILGWDIFEDVISPDGIAPNGLIAFFQKIISWFQTIVAWFKSFFKIA